MNQALLLIKTQLNIIDIAKNRAAIRGMQVAAIILLNFATLSLFQYEVSLKFWWF